MQALAELKNILNDKLNATDSFGASMKLVLDDNALFIDGHAQPASLSAYSNQDADCTVTCSVDLALQIFKKEVDASQAFMSGDLQVDGDTGAALTTLGALFG